MYYVLLNHNISKLANYYKNLKKLPVQARKAYMRIQLVYVNTYSTCIHSTMYFSFFLQYSALKTRFSIHVVSCNRKNDTINNSNNKKKCATTLYVLTLPRLTYCNLVYTICPCTHLQIPHVRFPIMAFTKHFVFAGSRSMQLSPYKLSC